MSQFCVLFYFKCVYVIIYQCQKKKKKKFFVLLIYFDLCALFSFVDEQLCSCTKFSPWL